jgi:hypothetical protein
MKSTELIWKDQLPSIMKWYKTYVAKAPGERFRAICYAWNMDT